MSDTLWSIAVSREPSDVIAELCYGLDIPEIREFSHQPREHAVPCATCGRDTARVHGYCGACLKAGHAPRALNCPGCGGRE